MAYAIGILVLTSYSNRKPSRRFHLGKYLERACSHDGIYALLKQWH